MEYWRDCVRLFCSLYGINLLFLFAASHSWGECARSWHQRLFSS